MCLQLWMMNVFTVGVDDGCVLDDGCVYSLWMRGCVYSCG